MKRYLVYEIIMTLLGMVTLVFRFSTFHVFEKITLSATVIIGLYCIFKTMKGSSPKEQNLLFHLFLAMGMCFSLANGIKIGFSFERVLFWGLSLLVLTEALLEKQ